MGPALRLGRIITICGAQRRIEPGGCGAQRRIDGALVPPWTAATVRLLYCFGFQEKDGLTRGSVWRRRGLPGRSSGQDASGLPSRMETNKPGSHTAPTGHTDHTEHTHLSWERGPTSWTGWTTHCVPLLRPPLRAQTSTAHLPLCPPMLMSSGSFGACRCLSSSSVQTPGPRIKRILVANRGEIACRVMRTAARMGVGTVAVYSDVDKNALHVQQADEAVRIGGALATDSYLKAGAILDAALATGAQAVHPGYGFLSENALFAEQCAKSGIEFIGPPPSAILSMGDKSEAKSLMTAAGVPVVPGYHGEEQGEERLRHEAEAIGYPVLIKATQGGGGKGMRIVRGREEFREGLEGAVREAVAAFGNGRVLLERYIQQPRHIEVQIFGDKMGNVVHLFERDCSIQRRHQKVIEESPAPELSEELRQRLGSAAVDAGKAVGYVSAGTVEFIFDRASDDFFFMEMNTRLQVEHPVTEMVVGQDLVEWQIQIANGERLPLLQHELGQSGHAIEARVYAENVPRGFLPSSGKLLLCDPPAESPSVRVETGVRQGDTITTFYDPLIAKLVVWDQDRPAAILKLQTCLKEYHIAGLPTNVPFLSALAAHPAFLAGDLDTHFIERYKETLLPHAVEGEGEPSQRASEECVQEHRLAAAAAAACRCIIARWHQQREGSSSPWDDGSSFRVNHTFSRPFALQAGKEGDVRPLLRDSESIFHLSVEFRRGGSFAVKEAKSAVGSKPVEVSGKVLDAAGEKLQLFVGGRKMDASYFEYCKEDVGHIHLWLGQLGHYHFTYPRPVIVPQYPDHSPGAHHHAASAKGGHAKGAVVSPMAGRVVRVCVSEGDTVQRGDAAVILESMKMEHTVRASCSGTVAEVAAQAGRQVSDGAVLLRIVPNEAHSTP